jgi:tRNA modification GTPase
MNAIYSIDTTIFAWATLHQPGGRAVLRLSGDETIKILNKIFMPDENVFLIPRCALPGTITFNDDLKVRVWTWFFKKPASYTGQDMAEIHLPGSVPLMKMIDQQLIHMGLSPAAPGEFTARAFLLGKMDLTQAQAVRELVDARNDAQIEAAMNMLEGKLHRQLSWSYEKLSDMTSLIEADIDFSEDEIDVISLDKIKIEIESLKQTIHDILSQAIDSRTLSSLPKVFLAGPANAGKSTLLNRLTKLDRAICSPLPGTTRDILSAPWRFGEREVMLCDTAGLLTRPQDQITQIAIDHSREFLRLADIVLFVFDATAPLEEQLQLYHSIDVNKESMMVVINKTDQTTDAQNKKIVADLETDIGRTKIFTISSPTGKNIDRLSAAVFEALENRSVTTAGGQIALDLRGRQVLEEVLSSLEQAASDAEILLKQTQKILGLEIVAASLQQAMRSLGSLLGKDFTENVLENIFSRFCIGK